MKKQSKLFILILCVGLLLPGCGNFNFGHSNNGHKYEEFLVIDVFDELANFQGIQSGWFAKVVRDKFNMELNIIAPNVAGGRKTIFEMRAAAGNIGDLIICEGERGILQEMVTSRLVLDMTDLLKDKQIMRYRRAIDNLNNDITPGGIYGIPSEVSENSPLTPSEGLELTFGPYLRWDIYASIGYPEMDTLEDLLPVLLAMQEAYPVSESGKPVYGFSFFRDWDGNLMNAAKQPACFYGYDELGFALIMADGSDYQCIMDDDSMYMRVLRFFYEANQLGLVDPESIHQNFDATFEKYKNGEILYSPWPWLGQSAFNTITNRTAGKGFMIADIADMKILSLGSIPEGNPKTIIAIGSQAKDPQRLADFIDWLYSPEGIFYNGAQPSGGTAGPEGLCWVMGENGPELTDFGKLAFFENDTLMPEEWGGGTWEDGVSALNYKTVALSELTPDGFPYLYTMWDSVLAMEETKLEADWRAVMGASSTKEYLQKNGKMIVAPGTGYTIPPEPLEITTIRTWCQPVILEYSWRMIFARNKDHFYSLKREMQDTVRSFGYDKVIEADLINARKLNETRRLAVEAYGTIHDGR
ncbi:MAG: ABC transporter substrate-binding protein [Lachnospiraceae bacterium]|nr:ABC transporter substrate-binding protein [Lachnospiraceae bacterium]